ncbi:MAG: hybrid sensor histidine kinase/response regulator, partial [Cupriavidus sp.]
SLRKASASGPKVESYDESSLIAGAVPAAQPEPVATAAAAPLLDNGWDPLLFWKPEDEQTGLSALRRETARVPVESLDAMLNEAGEISIYRSRLEEQHSALQAQLNEMSQAVTRVREQLRMMDIETEAQISARGRSGPMAERQDRYAGDFDPLEMDRYTRMQELSRSLSESIGDLSALHTTMDGLVGEAETLLLQQARINTDVQQGLMRTLMVPFSRQVARLQRVVKQAAQDNGKLADAQFDGVESELDRNVLERMTAPLEHLMRNAVVHGIEDPQTRVAAGKGATGTVSVSLRREGTQLLVELRDDGRGLDFDAIRRTAIKRGLIPADAQVADEDIAQFIFEAGFSTAQKLTQDAGRGIGMDVVAAEVKQLGGTLEIGSETGKGARFLIRLPLNLAISQALLVSVSNEMYAIPLPSIEGIARIPRDQLDSYYSEDGPSFGYGGHEYRVRYLGDFIGTPRDVPREGKTVSAILVRLGEGLGTQDRRVAVVVDGLHGNREVVSKAVGPLVSSVVGVSSATILADGRVVLILDVPALTQDRTRRALITLAAGQRETVSSDADARELIMVVDDSITIRRVTERLLLKHGYRVSTAKDGLDAMAKLQTESPVTILLDIEMPRADGFEVATFIRNNERIRKVPIIMITSRSGDKHRERAMQIGVNRYLIKPYQEDQLISEVRGVLEETKDA